MKTRYIVWALVFVALIAVGIWAYRKYTAAKRLTVGIDSFKLDKTNILNAIVSGITAKVNVLLGNYSNTPLNLQQMQIQVYTPTGELIATQTEPLSNEKQLQANQNNLLPLSIAIPRAGVTALFKSMNVTAADILNRLADYAINEKLGATLNVKGFVTADGITVNIDETIKI